MSTISIAGCNLKVDHPPKVFLRVMVQLCDEYRIHHKMDFQEGKIEARSGGPGCKSKNESREHLRIH